jgi:transketolase
VTLEEHTIIGGLGSAVIEIIAEANLPNPKKVKRLCIPDVFPDKYGSQASLMIYYELTVKALNKAVKKLVAI